MRIHPMRFHREFHRVDRIGWLRAAVLGANDGLISTASLIMGVAAAELGTTAIFAAGLAGLVGGALSMGAGEYVSVSSQSDSENADLARERAELETTPEAEHRELAGIYVQRGLTRELAEQVATAMTAHDALAAHARDELGITEQSRARPLLAAVTSTLSFALGAAVPLVLVQVISAARLAITVFICSLVLLISLGAIGALLGGARLLPAALRVAFWGVLAMGVTALIGRLFGVGIPV
jgi:VIT1/CCC1 family predicted Fe2+/Mn2+ transporter